MKIKLLLTIIFVITLAISMLILTGARKTFLLEKKAVKQGLYIGMELIPPNPFVGHSIRLKVIVENRGRKPIKIVQMNSCAYEENWGGWTVQIDGPNGRYAHIQKPKPLAPICSSDVRSLNVNEFFDLTFAIDDTCLHGGAVAKAPLVRDTAGDYAVRIIYAPVKGMFGLEKEMPEDLFVGPESSDVFEFTVKKK